MSKRRKKTSQTDSLEACIFFLFVLLVIGLGFALNEAAGQEDGYAKIELIK